MFKLKLAFFVSSMCIICFLISLISVFAEESLTITTYYPSPYGSYRELRSQRMAIGDNYVDGGQYCWEGTCTNTINANADLVVEGNVGIGTVNPQQKLDVAGWISVAGGGNTASNGIGGGTNSTNGPFVQLFGGLFPNVSRRGELANVSFGSGNITFFNEPSANVWNQLMTITPEGHVGIGTTNPGAKLDVNGDIRWIQPFNTGLLDNTTESSAQENVLLTAGCIKRNNENYSADHWMSCPRGFYVAAITDDEVDAQDVLCCPF